MKITMYELLGLVKDGKAPKKIKYDGIIWQADYALGDYTDNCQWLFEKYFKERSAKGFINDEVEILEEMTEEEKYVRGWNKYCKVVYDMNNPNSKEEPTTCEEFAKIFQENCRMFQPEEKKIPEKIKIEQDTPSSNYYIRNENGTKCGLTKHSKMIVETLNQVIDYLKSKGE